MKIAIELAVLAVFFGLALMDQALAATLWFTGYVIGYHKGQLA